MVNSLLKGQVHLLKCTHSVSFRVRWKNIAYKIRKMLLYSRHYSQSCCKLMIYTTENFTYFKAHPTCVSSREQICVSSGLIP